MKRRRDLRVWVGGAVLGGSVVTLASALSGALMSSPAGTPGERPLLNTEAAVQTAPAAEPVASDAMTTAVEKAPFDPQRRAPRGRYLLPEDMVVEAPPPPPPPAPPPPEFRVLATVGAPGGGVAVIEVEGEPPRVVAVGQEVMGYSVASIDSRSMVVSKEGRDVRVAMAEPTAAVVAAAPTNTRGQQNRGGRPSNAAGRNNGAQEAAVYFNFQARPGSAEAEAGSRVQEALQRLRERQQQAQPGGGGNQGRPNQNRNPSRPPGGG